MSGAPVGTAPQAGWNRHPEQDAGGGRPVAARHGMNLEVWAMPRR